MKVAEAVGRALYAAGVEQVFGVVGSGNFHLTNAMVAAGARFVAARHEGGAATMADAYARVSGTVAAVSVHQGPGLTNAMTGIAEAAKSRTPLVVVAAEVTRPTSNFYVDQEALGTAVGAVPMRVASPEDAVGQACAAVRRALHERRTVLLNLPLDVQAADALTMPSPRPHRHRGARRSSRPPTKWRLWPRCWSRPGGRSSWPDAVRAHPGPGTPSKPSPSAAAPCWRPRPWRVGCSTTTPGRSTCPAASPRPWRPNSSAGPT